MEALAGQAVLLIAVLATIFAGPLLAVAFVTVRRRRARTQRRSPMRRALLRLPGHSLREQLDEATGTVMSDIFMLMLVPLMMLAMFLAHGHIPGLQRTAHLPTIYTVVVLGFVAFMVHRLWKAGTRLDRLKAGLDAELAVGQELDQLMRQGAAVYHDVPAEGFNIDHVVVSKAGIFAVETKGFTKQVAGSAKENCRVGYDGRTLRFPNWTTTAPLEQAERQSDWLAKWLSGATGSPVCVHPVLALPGWFIEHSGRGPVRVYSGAQLPELLQARGPQTLTEQEVQRAAFQLDQRCRTVELLYSQQP